MHMLKNGKATTMYLDGRMNYLAELLLEGNNRITNLNNDHYIVELERR